MRKNFKYYIIIWAVLLAVFNAVTFLTPNELAGFSKFGGAFWSGYAAVTAAFIGQLVCAYIAFRAENAEKLFLNLPLITVSYTALIVTLIVGAAAMLIPELPQWAGGIVCLLVLAFGAVSVLKARAAAQIAGDRENQVGEQTSFIRGITAEAQILMGRASSPLIKEKCKKIYEALRYSDPVSVSALADTERSIREEFGAFSDAVSAADLGGAESACEALLALINERNAACRLLK